MGAFALWLPVTSVAAQSPTSTPAAPAPAQTVSDPPPQPVTVVAATPGYRSTIDRQSYSVAGDLQKDTGSLADVLRNLPAVQVDLDGNVSLRGDSNVTILVDGKPSALFSGPGRAQALQSISVAQYSRIEVMTNPPAGVTSEGSGGVINLISRKPPTAGAAPVASGTAKATVGSGGRSDLGLSGAYTGHGLSLTGGADFRRSGFSRDVRSLLGLPDPANGGLIPAESLSSQKYREDSLTAYATAGYDLGAHDRIETNVSANSGRLVENADNAFQTETTTGPLALSYTAPGFIFDGHFTSLSGSLRFTHTLPGDGHSLSAKLTFSQSRLTVENGATYTYEVPVQSSQYQSSIEAASYPELDLAIDYNTPLPDKAKLTLGYEATIDWEREDIQTIQGDTAASAAANAALSEMFNRHQQVHAIYATYQQTVGKLTAQTGLRLEDTILETDLVSAGQTGRQDYLEANPNLHFDYALDDASQIKASYSRRTQRPNIGQMDPYRNENTATLYYAGNPNLRPAITQSYELGYEFQKKTTDLQATLFYRDKSNLLTQVFDDIGSDVLLATWENLGHEHDAGLELVARLDLTRTLSLNASTDILREDVDAENLGIVGKRSASVASWRVTLNWQATPKDYVQLGGGDTGRQLTAQGYRGGAAFSNLGWRHRFDPRVDALLTVDNPFGLARRTIVTDTPVLIDVENHKQNAVAVFFGLTIAFGSAPKSPEGFKFESHDNGNP